MAVAVESPVPAVERRTPGHWKWWCALFLAYERTGDVSEALSSALRTISNISKPEEMFLPVGRMLHMNGMHDAAVAIYEKILVHQPDARLTHGELLVHYQLYGRDDDARREAERWNDRFILPLSNNCTRATTLPEIGRPLRIGFVSNDFAGDHSLNTVMAPWFGPKEHRSDEYFLYSNQRHLTLPHGLFLDAAAAFVAVKDFSDEDLDARIRQDGIDILVDMISHGEHNRLLTYARKPAPIIVSWIGTGIPTGVATVDYILADKGLVPSETIARYREKVVHLPQAAMVWCPPKAAPPIGPAPSSKRGYVVFGNLTRVVKFQRETIELWARVLHRVPGSKLMLKDRRLQGENARRILSMFERCAIEPRRLILKQGSSHMEHLATYNEIDIVLDCFPQNGGVSSLEAVWMGVPVLSICHPTKPSGRVGRYILESVGLPALVTATEDEFVGLAEQLARNPDLLAPLRGKLRRSLARSPLCDAEAFQRNIAAAFRHMWKRYCSNQKPESFTVEAS